MIAHDPPTALTRTALLLAFSGIMLATFLAALDQTIVATALPAISGDLHGFDDLSWVFSAYLVTSTLTMPLYGKLSDVHGRRALFVVAIAIFMLGSCLCAIAGSMTELIAFRAVQGIGAGGLLPLSQTAIADLFPPRERGRYQGFTGAVWATAAVAGPLVGGSLTDGISWRWIFWINLPLGALALFAVVRTMRVPVVRREHRIDVPGIGLLSVGVTCVLLAALWGGVSYPWGSPQVVGTAVAGVALCLLFVAVERRVAEPLLPLPLFADRTFAVSVAACVVIGAVLFGVTVYVPVFVQGVLGSSATSSGVVLMPLALGWVVAAFVHGQTVARTGRYRFFPIVGMTLILTGVALLATIDEGTSRAAIGADLALIGIGMGVSFQTYVVATQNAVPATELGIGTASLLFFRTIGASLSVAALGALLNNRLASELPERLGAGATQLDRQRLLDGGVDVPAALEHGTSAALSASLGTVFLVVVPVALAGVALSILLPERPLRSNVH